MRIEDIKDPSFLKQLNKKELEKLCQDIRDFIIEAVAKNGGHLSSNLGVVEASVALHYVFNSPEDKIMFDVGHQSYTHKILTGRANELMNSLRQFNGLSGFQKRRESIHDAVEAGHSSTILSLAQGIAVSQNLDSKLGEVIAFVGDSSIASGLAFEALNNFASLQEKVIIILNDNEMSISKPVGGLGKLMSKLRKSSGYQNTKKIIYRGVKWAPWLVKFLLYIKNKTRSFFLESNIFEQLNIEYIGPYDGHDVMSLIKAFNIAKKSKETIMIHITTKKGKGYDLAEGDSMGYWHGVEPFNAKSGLPIKPIDETSISWSYAISDIVLQQAEFNKDLVMITPAMITGAKMENIFLTYPERSFDVGIAEEHAVTFAAGLALGGKLPYINLYSTFMQRAYDNLNHDLARMNLPAIIGVDRAGIVGEDGETHQGHYDVEITKGLPNCFIAMPYDYIDAQNIFIEATNSKLLAFIRVPRGKLNPMENYHFNPMKIGKWSKIHNGSSRVLVISTGPITNKIKELIYNKYPTVSLIFARFYKPIDEELLLEVANQYDEIIIYDIYATKNALYSDVVNFVHEHKIKANVSCFVLPNDNIPQGKIDEILVYLKISLEDLSGRIRKLLNT